MKLTSHELATVLAALRLWQKQASVPAGLARIASDDDAFSALDDDEIDELCERINVAD